MESAAMVADCLVRDILPTREFRETLDESRLGLYRRFGRSWVATGGPPLVPPPLSLPSQMPAWAMHSPPAVAPPMTSRLPPTIQGVIVDSPSSAPDPTA